MGSPQGHEATSPRHAAPLRSQPRCQQLPVRPRPVQLSRKWVPSQLRLFLLLPPISRSQEQTLLKLSHLHLLPTCQSSRSRVPGLPNLSPSLSPNLIAELSMCWQTRRTHVKVTLQTPKPLPHRAVAQAAIHQSRSQQGPIVQ